MFFFWWFCVCLLGRIKKVVDCKPKSLFLGEKNKISSDYTLLVFVIKGFSRLPKNHSLCYFCPVSFPSYS